MLPRFFLCALSSLAAVVPAAVADTVAYYRFDDVTGERIPSLPTRPTVRDASGRGLDLYAYKTPAVSTTVPNTEIPQTRSANTRALYTTGTEDIYAKPNDGLSRVVFTDFTIEAWVKFESLTGTQTIVGRDSFSRDQGAGALFYLSKTTHTKPGLGQKENAFRVELVTRGDRSLLIESDFKATADTWYHTAVVGNVATGTVTLFVDGRPAGTATDFDGLFVSPANPGWTIARGQYASKAGDHVLGWIDEVRFSDTALKPSQFLNSPPVADSSRGAKPAAAR